MLRDAWIQPEVGPPYYANLVTISLDGKAAQLAAVEDLKQRLPGGFSVKDSFYSLDLSEDGFELLFRAEWLRLGPGKDVGGDSSGSTRVFRPALLDEPDIAFLGLVRAGRFVAGCCANRSTGDVAGFSNYFSLIGDGDEIRAGAIAATQAFAGGGPLVGYQRDESLTALEQLGFERVGGLRVWVIPSARRD